MSIIETLKSNSKWIDTDDGTEYTINIYPNPNDDEVELISIKPLFTLSFRLLSETRGVLSALKNTSRFDTTISHLEFRLTDDDDISIKHYNGSGATIATYTLKKSKQQ